MQDQLPDLPPLPAETSVKAGPVKKGLAIFSDDKRLVKIILLAGFGLLLILGIAVSILEQVAPRDGKQPREKESASGFWQVPVQPNQIILGFFEDKNKNNRFDYQEKPFSQVSVAIRRAGESEPFRRVSADRDGLVKIDDLSQAAYEVSLDNYVSPEAGEWQFFEEYQQNGEFLPTAWRQITLAGEGYKELIGITAYRPSLLLALTTDTDLVWYDPDRARVYGRSNFNSEFVARGKDIYYLKGGKLWHLDWQNKSVIEEMIWLEEAGAGGWQLSSQAKTVTYWVEKELNYRSQIEDCSEGSLLYEGVRPEVKAVSFIDETSWLASGRLDAEQPWQVFKVNCDNAQVLSTIAEPQNVGSLTAEDWFYSTGDATYLVDANGKAVKYTALGGGEGISVSPDKRYLSKKLSVNSWLVVDYPGVKAEGVEKHYLLTGIVGEPTIIGDEVYFVRAKACEVDGDCGEVVQLNLQGSGVWSVGNTWDLKNVPAKQVLSVLVL